MKSKQKGSKQSSGSGSKQSGEQGSRSGPQGGTQDQYIDTSRQSHKPDNKPGPTGSRGSGNR